MIDATRQRVHIRNAKGNRDRFVPLPAATLLVLRRYWQVHRNPVLLQDFLNAGLRGSFYKSPSVPLFQRGMQRQCVTSVNNCQTLALLRGQQEFKPACLFVKREI